MKKLNFTKNTIEGAFWGLANKIVGIIFPFIIRTVLINRLGSEYAGLGSLFSSILQVLSLADLGFTSAAVYAMYRPIAENNAEELSALLNYYKKIYLTIGFTIILIGMAIMPFLTYLIKSEYPDNINIYLLFLIYLFNTSISYIFFSYRSSVLSAYQKESVINLISLISNFVVYAIQIFVLIEFANFYIYSLLLIASTLLANFLKNEYVKRKYPNIRCEGKLELVQRENILKNIKALFLHKIGGVTVNTIDNIVISSFLGLIALSNYNNYYYIISAVTSLLAIVFSSITAGIGNRLVINSLSENKRDFYIVFYANSLIVSILTVLLFSTLQDFITFWLGSKYIFSSTTTVLFASYFYIHTIRKTVIVYRDAAGMWDDNKWQPIISAAVNLTLNILLIQTIGINGVIISTLISMILVDIPWETQKLIHSLFKERSAIYYRRMCFSACMTCFCCILTHWVIDKIEMESCILRLIIDICISGITTLLLWLIFTSKTSEFSYLKDKVLAIIDKKHFIKT